jgi:hypothetical protein
MRKMLVRLLIAASLLLAGEAFRRAAAIENSLAATQEQLTMLPASVTPASYDAIEADLALAAQLPIVGEPLLNDVRMQRARAAYWNGDYAAVREAAATADEENRSADLMFLAANARYRDAVRAGSPRATLLRNLDEVLKGYGDVLKADAAHAAAAYNYEFVSRLRTALARGQQSINISDDARPNMQGEEGEPPKGTKPPEFNVIVPMRPDERQEQFDAGVGGVTRRRG